MTIRPILAAFTLALAPMAPMSAAADSPTRQEVTVVQEIAAPPADVWAAIGNFDDMSWHPVVFSAEGDGGNSADATRLLTLGEAGGPTIAEALDKHSDEAMSYSYRITEVDVNVLPVTDYSSSLTVRPGADGGSLVEWSGAFLRGDPGDDPAEGLNDEAAVGAITGVYESGLAALKTQLEAAN